AGAPALGWAFGRASHAENARVAILDLNEQAASRLAEELGSPVVASTIDVRERQSVQAAIDRVVGQFGGIDILCANAGVSTMQRSLDLTDDDWDFNMNVNAR